MTGKLDDAERVAFREDVRMYRYLVADISRRITMVKIKFQGANCGEITFEMD